MENKIISDWTPNRETKMEIPSKRDQILNQIRVEEREKIKIQMSARLSILEME